MPQENTKKLSILYLLKVLREETDENHPLTQQELAQRIENISGIVCERKSIASNISNLIDFGVDIQKADGKKGYYLASREFEPSEISFLVDALFSSKSLSSKQAQKLAEKLYASLSKYQKKDYKYIYKADDIARTDNKQIFYTIDIINEAIEKNKQIKFNYNRFNVDKEKAEKQKAKTYIINPYFMINNQGRYFLVCNLDYYDDIANYKIDLILNIELLDTPIKPVTKLKNYEKGIDKAKYANDNIYMFGGQVVKAKIKITSEYAENYVQDWFGKNARIYKQNGETFADVSSNENALVYWALQYGENVELLEPLSTRERVKTIVKCMMERYK